MDRKRTLNLARVIYAAWVLADDNEENITPMPSSDGLWARAMYRLKEKGQIPPEIADDMTFIDGHQGLEYLEASAIRAMAAEILVTRPDPFADTDKFEVSKAVGRHMAVQSGIPEERLIVFGKALRAAMLGNKEAAPVKP
jgi:hypothetical protein